MRVGEALGIHVQHVNLNDVDGGFIRIIGKGDKERIVPLIDAPRTVRLLREVMKKLGTVGPVFRGDIKKGGRAGEAVDYTTMLYHFERCLDAARETHPEAFTGEAEPITIHRFRHTFGTLRLREGISLPSVRKLMGHKNIQTTLRYADADLETIKRELTCLIDIKERVNMTLSRHPIPQRSVVRHLILTALRRHGRAAWHTLIWPGSPFVPPFKVGLQAAVVFVIKLTTGYLPNSRAAVFQQRLGGFLYSGISS